MSAPWTAHSLIPPYAPELDFGARGMPSLKIRISSIIIRLESSLSSDSSSNCGKIARNPFNARISQRKERQTDQRPMIVRPGSQWDAGNSAIGRGGEVAGRCHKD